MPPVPQSRALLTTLKRSLRARGRTYADVARTLGLSEASVKRLFSRGDLSLGRLEAICGMLGLTLTDLLTELQSGQQALHRLTPAQEADIAGDLVLLLVTVCVLNRWRLQDILAHFRLDEPACIHRLARLDRMGLIELLPGNRIVLRTSANFAWLENGPIQQFFQRNIQQEFFGSRFDQPGEKLLVLNGMLSPASHTVFQRRLETLAHEFEQLNSADGSLPLDARQGVTVVLAMRHWRYGIFAHLLREPGA